MKVAVLFTGGKDSCLALHMASKEHYVKYLLTIIPENKDSFMFHKPDLKLLEKQAEELNKNLVIKYSEGRENEELEDLRDLLEKVKGKVNGEIEGVVVGGIASNYQGNRIKKICEELGLKFIAPLWDFSPVKIWRELFSRGFKVILTKISCEGLGKEWLGKVIDKEKFEELKKISKRYKFRLDFEGGEAETAVLYMPGMGKEIKIGFDIKSEGEYRHFLDIKEIED